MSFYNKFIGINNLPKSAQSLTRVYGLIRMLNSFILNLTSTFLILYIIDALGFEKASIVITVMLTVQLAIDYPSGSLGDHIGQRWVLGIAVFMISIAFFLLSSATSYIQFIVIAIIIGFANAQASGALQSWYDNNYKNVDTENDPEKKNYGFCMNRLGAADDFIMGITFIIGGLLATLFSRSFVFALQSLFSVIFAVLIIRLMQDIKGVNEIRNQNIKSFSKYLEYLKGGVKFVFKDKMTILFVFGISIFQFVWVIWGNLILFPLYFGYTGSDGLAGILRSILFFIGVGTSIVLSNLIRKINKNKMPIFFGLQALILFGGTILLFTIIPMQNQFSLIGFLAVIIIFSISNSIMAIIGNVLLQRIMIDFIPSKFRNSLYSFIPTVVGVLSILFLPLAGNIIEIYGLIYGVAFCSLFSISSLIMISISLKINQNSEIIITQQKAAPIAIGD